MYLILWKTASFTKWLQGLTGMFIWKQFENVVRYKSTVGVSSYPSALHLLNQDFCPNLQGVSTGGTSLSPYSSSL